jgi:hypothetical protein
MDSATSLARDSRRSARPASRARPCPAVPRCRAHPRTSSRARAREDKRAKCGRLTADPITRARVLVSKSRPRARGAVNLSANGLGSGRCRGGAVCRCRCRVCPLLAAPVRPRTRNLLLFLVLFGSCQRGGRRFEPGLVLQEMRAPSRCFAAGLSASGGGLGETPIRLVCLTPGFWGGASWESTPRLARPHWHGD